jgi:uncharacterized protein YdeI (YjbR/CyaY-like superfamily)
MITDIEDFFAKGCGRCERFATAQCAARLWNRALQELRSICKTAGLIETVKWGHPCYMHAGRNIALLGAFQSHCVLNFFNAALLNDSARILQKAGPNTKTPSIMRFTTETSVKEQRATVLSYLEEAMRHAEAGTLPPKIKTEIELPKELIDAMDADPELSEAFHKLTPGRQRSYVINLSSAKTSATRINRIEKFHDRIIKGKGANEY